MSALRLFSHVQLAEASYASFSIDGQVVEGTPNDGAVSTGLQNIGFSEAQAIALTDSYRVLHSRPNTGSGFSAMLVQSKDPNDPSLTLAIRGT